MQTEPLPTSDNRMILSEDQSVALDKIMDWIGTDKQVLTLGGLAGTGKSTLVDTIFRNTLTRISVCAYTGKAAHVLRTKGLKEAQTIHSLIYQPVDTCPKCGQQIERDEEALHVRPTCPRSACDFSVSETTFVKVRSLRADLIIVDEASMVSQRLHDDLLSFDKQILYVGDHGQLEPIGNNPNLMRDPEIRLEKIHRQAEGSDILRFAHAVRNHEMPKSTGPNAVVLEAHETPLDIANFDVVLCGLNTTRVDINSEIRKARGYTSDLPEPGERVVCLRNSKKHGIFNGMIAEIVRVRINRMSRPTIDILLDDGGTRCGLPFDPEQFGAEKIRENSSRNVELFDYGYCLTCHKSQGSEYDSVLVLEWIHRETSASRWRYTAATRAKKRLVWCLSPSR